MKNVRIPTLALSFALAAIALFAQQAQAAPQQAAIEGAYKMDDGYMANDLIVKPVSANRVYLSLEGASARGSSCSVEQVITVRNGVAILKDESSAAFKFTFAPGKLKIERTDNNDVAPSVCGISATIEGEYAKLRGLDAKATKTVALLQKSLKVDQSVTGKDPKGQECDLSTSEDPTFFRAFIYPKNDLYHSGTFSLSIAPAKGDLRKVSAKAGSVSVTVKDPEDAKLEDRLTIVAKKGAKTVQIAKLKAGQIVREFTCSISN